MESQKLTIKNPIGPSSFSRLIQVQRSEKARSRFSFPSINRSKRIVNSPIKIIKAHHTINRDKPVVEKTIDEVMFDSTIVRNFLCTN